MERFTDELQPRDVVTGEIRKQMKKDGTDFVWLSMKPIDREQLESHFPNIVKHCREYGYNVPDDCIPVVPAQHYFMGGIKVNLESKTSMDQLYAVGETACNGVHGKNRLASNSLLESLVFAKRAAIQMGEQYNTTKQKEFENIDITKYQDGDALAKEYKKLVLDEIDRLNNEAQQAV